MNIDDEKTSVELAAELVHVSGRAARRVSLDSNGHTTIAGWRGFHMDLDRIDELTILLRAKSRGI